MVECVQQAGHQLASTCLYVEARMDLLAKNGTKQSEAERQATQN